MGASHEVDGTVAVVAFLVGLTYLVVVVASAVVPDWNAVDTVYIVWIY